MIKSIVLTYFVKVEEDTFYKDKYFKSFDEVDQFVKRNPNLTYFKMKVVRESEK